MILMLLISLSTLYQPIVQHKHLKYKYTPISYYNFEKRKTNYERMEKVSLISLIKSNGNYIVIKNNPKTNVLDYLEQNKLDEYELFTILNECCKSIMMYHVLLNCYHSNTTIGNFDLYDDNTCNLSTVGEDNQVLTKRYNVIDYVMFFDSFIDTLYLKNVHFIVFAKKFQQSFMKTLFNTKD